MDRMRGLHYPAGSRPQGSNRNSGNMTVPPPKNARGSCFASTMSASWSELSRDGEFFLNPNAELTSTVLATQMSKPLVKDLINVCDYWYRPTPEEDGTQDIDGERRRQHSKHCAQANADLRCLVRLAGKQPRSATARSDRTADHARGSDHYRSARVIKATGLRSSPLASKRADDLFRTQALPEGTLHAAHHRGAEVRSAARPAASSHGIAVRLLGAIATISRGRIASDLATDGARRPIEL